MKDINLVDLYDTKKLQELDQRFLVYLQLENIELYQGLIEARGSLNWQSKLAIDLSSYLERFIVSLFSIEEEFEQAQIQYSPLSKIYECKRSFVQRYALKSNQVPVEDIDHVLSELEKLISVKLSQYNVDHFEQVFAEHALNWLNNQEQDKLNLAVTYTIWACLTLDGQKKHQSGVLFKFPHKLDFNNLIELERKKNNGVISFVVPEEQVHQRDGFELTDKGCKLNFAVDQAHYCIHCHKQEKDTCSKGINAERKGCPLDEKISEMNYLKARGNIIGSLAMAIIDNPMLAATGHRICNDCMKACIYQKQQPVDIPQIETRALKDVLALPWGFEIYSLLTRWNPLSLNNFYPKNTTGAKVLVVGMGPAGFTLAHYLLNQGHVVVGIDGLKIEPLPTELINQPIKHISDFFEELDQRLISGFGGVMEYGITNRWDKNFLLIIRLLLERRANFKLFGGVRFGSNITPQQAFDLGFQHIALALGAGSPKLLSLENAVAKGIRTASDFLMSLQLGAAYRKDSLTNLQIRMPALVIGGGLTALDAATETLAYYPQLIKKFVTQHRVTKLDQEAQEVAQEFIEGQEIPSVKILYRGKLQQAPSYRLNHEELALGLKEGVEFIENITPTKILLDKYGHVSGLEAIQIIDDEEKRVTLSAKTILIAAGTVPNTVLADEFPSFLQKDGKYFKQLEDRFITYKKDNHSISFIGDLHPEYAGNVVKAMASAKHSYAIISKLLQADYAMQTEEFFAHLSEQLTANLVGVNRLTSNIVELIIKSPLAAQNFQPGQFFRLQNYANSGLPLMEGVALTGAKVNKSSGIISTIVLEMGTSSNLCAKLPLNLPIVLMGPTGAPSEIRAEEKVMLIGGGLGNAVLFSIGQEFRAKNSQVLYFAGYRKLVDRYKIEEIEAAADQIIWSCDEGELSVTRPQDKSFHGNIIDSLLEFAQANPNALKAIDRIIVIGSDKMMHAVKKARHNILKPYLNPKHIAIASVNSPMQCMMKEICGQCLQKHIDPITGVESYVFSCTNQDQEMDQVDFYHLESRLSQNYLLEKNI
jgi:NADPH-dependent glutamate synthase beta subunit-like oxidoreductase/NAD(P)H-flavin reductase